MFEQFLCELRFLLFKPHASLLRDGQKTRAIFRDDTNGRTQIVADLSSGRHDLISACFSVSNPPVTISIQTEASLSVGEFISVLQRSTLAQRRPVDEVDRIAGMLKHASCIVTARNEDGLLVGVARSISDFHYCTYLSDLAVDEQFQRQGIGKQLIEATHEACGLQSTLLLLSAPKAESYYPHIKMQPHNSCWIRPAEASSTK